MSKSLPTLVALVLLAGTAGAKTGRTHYTDARIATARANIEKYDWAKTIRRRIFETGDRIRYYIGPEYTAADTFVEQSDMFMWRLMPPTRIPRYVPRADRAWCPVHGEEVRKHNAWCPYNIDPINRPYQIQCMMGKEWYPSNRYDEGDLISGDYPDDGNGIELDGKRFYPLREYAHMVYGSVVVPTLRSLSQAYLLSGDARYAHKGSILLASLAAEYPNYGWEANSALGLTARPELEDRSDRTYYGPWGNSAPDFPQRHGGLVTDHIWECFMLEAIAYAYDALYDYLDDPDLLAFLRERGMPVTDGDALRATIEDYVLRAGMRALLLEELKGNEGHHQAAAMALALVLDDHGEAGPNSRHLVDYTWHGVGNAAYIMTNSLTRDGGGHESPNYARIKLDFIRVARRMEELRRAHPDRYPAETYPDLFASPKARAIFDYYIDIFVLDTFIPSIGDCGAIRAPVRRLKRDWSFLTHENLYAVERWGDPRYARACVTPDGELVPGELWEAYPEERIRTLLEDPASEIVRPSRLLDGYGVGILESGTYPNARAAVLNYASLTGHRQDDALTLGLYARGVDYLMDLGYPKTWNWRTQYDSNSMAHNTVTVDETPFCYGAERVGRLFGSLGGVHVAAASYVPYPRHFRLGRADAAPVDLYERMVVMVDLDDDRFYVVDLFAVRGGEQHDQSWHAFLKEPVVPDLDWQAQETGTLAGPDIERWSADWTDRWGRPRDDFPAYVVDVRRARLSEPAVWTWPTGLPEGDALALHVLPVDGPAEVIMGKGRTPVRQELDFLFVRRTVSGGGPSRFLTVLDAYQGEPTVRSARLVSMAPLILEVHRDGAMDRITLQQPLERSDTTDHRPLGVRVVVDAGQAGQRTVRFGAMAGAAEQPGYSFTRIAAVRYDDKAMAVLYTEAIAAACQPGRTLRIFNDLRSGLYRIEAAEREGDLLWLTLDHSALFARAKVAYPWLRELELNTPLIISDKAAGTRVLEGDDALEVLWATRKGTVVTRERCTVEILRNYHQQTVNLWTYGVGDSVEAPQWQKD